MENKFHELDDKTLKGKVFYYADAEDYLIQLLAEELLPPLKDDTNNESDSTRNKIINVLTSYRVPLVIYRILNVKESESPELVSNLIEAWEGLGLPAGAPRHILILCYEFTGNRYKDKQLIEGVKKFISIKSKEHALIPETASPAKKHVEEWVNTYFEDSNKERVKEYIGTEVINLRKLYESNKYDFGKRSNRIKIKANDYEAHHFDLKDILINALSGRWKLDNKKSMENSEL